MARHLLWSVLGLWIWTAMAAAQSWQSDQWHHIIDGTPFHTEDGPFLHGAGILQSDGRFALMVLAEGEEGALVSVNLPVTDLEAELTSTLVMPDGNIFVRDVKKSDRLAEPTPDGRSVTFSFAIAEDDIAQFMAAQTWRVTTGDIVTTISLAGSRDAITTAREAREAVAVESAAKP